MVSLLIGLARFWAAIRFALRDPMFRVLAALTASLLSRFADALIQSHQENKERLHVHLAHAHEKLASKRSS
jgi:hypothetical protein